MMETMPDSGGASGAGHGRKDGLSRELDTKTVALPRLNNLQPTLEMTALKLMEEAGELGAAIRTFRGLEGHAGAQPDQQALLRVARELLDVAQTAVTMMYVLEEQHGVDLETALAQHVDKLLQKGYLRL
jgi:NTP pyrophosphatase (non-canonical NTP hydrolase)